MMNAMQAKALSNSHIPKKVDKNFQIAVSLINQNIEYAAKQGEFIASAQINLPIPFLEEFLDRLVLHYQNKGYVVKVYNFLLSKMVFVSWK